MTGHTVRLSSEFARQRAHQMIERAPPGYVVRIDEPTRSGEQNAKMHAMLTDISRAKPLDRKHTPDIWKAILMSACGHEQQFEHGIDGRPFPLGFRSSRMTKAQMSDFIEYLYSFGAEHDVAWSEPKLADAA